MIGFPGVAVWSLWSASLWDHWPTLVLAGVAVWMAFVGTMVAAHQRPLVLYEEGFRLPHLKPLREALGPNRVLPYSAISVALLFLKENRWSISVVTDDGHGFIFWSIGFKDPDIVLDFVRSRMELGDGNAALE